MRLLFFAVVAIGSSMITQTFAQGSCTDVATAECSDHEGCELCKMDVSWAKVEFCVSEEIADKLPEQLFTCGEENPPLQLSSDECSDLDKHQCEGNASCAWCVSAAVPSACYTIEQAKRLPAAVFSCEIPSIAQY
ncbi:hypothetical protein Ndes2526B_g01780 [Nannochloris sp. 'desiccata']